MAYLKLTAVACLLLLFTACGGGGKLEIIPTAHAQASTGNEIFSGRYIYRSDGWTDNAKGGWQPFFEAGQVVADGQGHFTLIGTMNNGGQIVPARSTWSYQVRSASGSGSASSDDVADIFCNANGSLCYFINTRPSTNWLATFTRE